MLPQLSKSGKLNKELQGFRDKAKLLDESKQSKVMSKIFEIKKLAENIDIAHDSKFNGFINPSLLSETRTEINKLRFEISQILNNR